jgi:hypothetical protein
MANDRLMLRCVHCGEECVLASYWVDHFYAHDSDALELWMKEHMLCDERGYPLTFDNGAPFTLETEATSAEKRRAAEGR